MRYALSFFASILLSLALTPLVRKYAIKYRFVVHPKQDRWRRRVIATLGGIAIFVSFLISALVFGIYNLKFFGFIFGALGIFWLGLVDDVIQVKSDTKLIGQIIVACVAILFGISFNISSSPLINIPLTIFWLVGSINAFNLLDNMDGLCAGIASISALMLGIHSFLNGNIQTTVLAALLLGAALGFLRYNFNPAKIFMGDCGSMFLGYSLGAIALMGAREGKSGFMLTMVIPALILAVPIFDTTLVTLARLVNNRAISQGGKDHSSHRLVALGLSEKKAVLFLYAISLICGLGSIMYLQMDFIIVSIVLVVILIALFIFGVFLGTEVKVYSSAEAASLEKRKKLNGQLMLNGFIPDKRRIIEVVFDFVIISISYISAFLLRYEGALSAANTALVLESLPLVLIIKFLTFYSFGLYRGVWRYVGIYDLIAIFKATLVGSVMTVMGVIFLFRFQNYSRAIFIIDWFITFVLVCSVRMLFRLYKEFFINIRTTGKRALIFGAGDAGELLLREIRQNRVLGYKPIGFVDDDEVKLEKIIHGVRVLGKGDDLEKLVRKYKIDEILIAITPSGRKRRQEVQETCKRLGITFKEVSKMISLETESQKE
ncbi:MAG: hypothetical protein NTV07_00325 [Candidatus Omnitrophica bacterium]|nr:hypothetical protein [Candidatus Omnitrophota bacterium]